MDRQTSHSQVLSHKQRLFLSYYMMKQYVSLLCLVLLLLTVTIIVRLSSGTINFQSLNFISSTSYTDHNSNKPVQIVDCDYLDGEWTWEEGSNDHPTDGTYYTEQCQFLDPGFRCHKNGREDQSFRKWQWRPHGCDLPRFNASTALERTRNRRIVFAGDSIGRNQWESLLCMLASGVTNQSTIYEEHGSPITKHKGFLSFRFTEHNLTVEYYRVPFLSPVARPPPGSSEQVKGVIRVDQLHWFSQKWVGADVLVFNNGHWWNTDKTINAGIYFQEGGSINMTMDSMEAFQKSLKTLKSWAVQNLDARRSHIFIRSFSPIHYTSGSWQEGTCKANTGPENDFANLKESKLSSSLNNEFIAETIKKMRDANMKAKYLNITYLSSFRNDGHPSVHREPGTPTPIREDCSHWCLPGIPDLWNQLMYAYLLSDEFST